MPDSPIGPLDLTAAEAQEFRSYVEILGPKRTLEVLREAVNEDRVIELLWREEKAKRESAR